MALPTVFWSIPCFDRRRTNPLPVHNRVYVLSWDLVPEILIHEVLEILKPIDRRTPLPSSFESSVISVCRTPIRPDNRMLAFRKYFVELPENATENCNPQNHSFITVNLHREYFEDETGKEISCYQMLQHVSGQKEPVISGDADSVLRLPYEKPVNVEQWTEDSANTVAHFIDVIERICESNWFRRPPIFTFEVQGGGSSSKFPSASDSKLLRAMFPNDKETVGVLAYFRQLHAKDKLFSNACEIFIRTCGDKRKTHWMTEQLESFKKMIDSPPMPFQEFGTRRAIIRMFMYGAGLLHANSDHGDDKTLTHLIQTHGQQRTVMVFNNCLWDILSEAIPAYHVIKSELKYWTKECKLVQPNRIDIPSLFEGFIENASN